MANLTHLWKAGQAIYTFLDGKKFSGKVKEVYPDHLIVDVDGISDHCWYQEGFNLDTLYPAYNFQEDIKMQINGIKLESRGKERIVNGRESFNRTVYCVPNQWKFYIKVNGEFVEVYHKSDYFSTSK